MPHLYLSCSSLPLPTSSFPWRLDWRQQVSLKHHWSCIDWLPFYIVAGNRNTFEDAFSCMKPNVRGTSTFGAKVRRMVGQSGDRPQLVNSQHATFARWCNQPMPHHLYLSCSSLPLPTSSFPWRLDWRQQVSLKHHWSCIDWLPFYIVAGNRNTFEDAFSCMKPNVRDTSTFGAKVRRMVGQSGDRPQLVNSQHATFARWCNGAINLCPIIFTFHA